MRRFSLLCLTAALISVLCYATDPTATLYTAVQCEGSLTPYPVEVNSVEYPDSLVPVYISHVGRHGSRYPASASNCLKLGRALRHADSLGTITPLGRELLALNERIIAVSNNRWGSLDSLGMAEQRAIATRMIKNYAAVFANDATVNAVSSYSPRSMMSMMSFVHQMDRLNNHLNFTTSTGRINSPTMRPFDTSRDYLDFRQAETWKPAYDEYIESTCPITAVTRVLGRDYPFGDTDTARDLAITEYYVLAGLSAMGMPNEMNKYFTNDEMNALWSCFNLRQYLQRTATTISSVPADIASDLLIDIINRADRAVDGTNTAIADLRFGHAETVMPLVSLMRLPGCYYLTNYFDTVAKHWRDFEVVPMASNVQFVFFKTVRGERWYVRVDFNERPVTLIPNDTRLYLPWDDARDYLMRCVPLYAQ